MALDRPVHALEAADGMTANEAAVVFVYRVKALRGRENNPMSNFVNVLRVGPEPNRRGACPLSPDKHAHRHAPSLGAYTLARRPVRLCPTAPFRRQQSEANYAQG